MCLKGAFAFKSKDAHSGEDQSVTLEDAIRNVNYRISVYLFLLGKRKLYTSVQSTYLKCLDLGIIWG